ncbi:TetR/AcrR family transcriptional regulator [Sphingomonas colocasiae]|uniref:TetR/AcrR family transcriptional regulator n=1 Tax=Sphingomonas colocasiae TaxID=1848973 RepID=A0ABS7PM26_9SPHN|nr:TetR/AcrR family transcriptional regulator [Sphingomonas colocasiae]MBY8822365.1 TetR/AcrR family transcriptional regulator [Sphingomonas colocasiae]
MKTKTADTEANCVCEPRKGAGLRIFETARELFYKRGIRAVGVDEIVCQAGVTKPSLYRSYESKDALVAACLESYAEESWVEIDAAVEAAGDNPRDQLRAIVTHYAVQMTSPDFRGCPMSNTAVEFPEPGHPGRPVVEDCKVAFRGRLVDITRRMDVREPEALADGLLMLIEGAYSTHHIFGSQGPALTLVRAADALIGAYSAR